MTVCKLVLNGQTMNRTWLCFHQEFRFLFVIRWRL